MVLNKLKLLNVFDRLLELSERCVARGKRHSAPLLVKLVEEYKAGFESRYVEYPTTFLIAILLFLLSFVNCSIGLYNKKNLYTLGLSNAYHKNLHINPEHDFFFLKFNRRMLMASMKELKLGTFCKVLNAQANFLSSRFVMERGRELNKTYKM
ncbi:hypothetical protein BpHYR1_046126 [Brachionus plicatilis]|uniref:Uncharacterized protein n=1 Tax=Brachionus plicatilis TaxID=10195 RepID=A0A3M7PWI1_BRAPC|nr:hypothetical protein BpHYR1_046126 [Brachionus plicatilis]